MVVISTCIISVCYLVALFSFAIVFHLLLDPAIRSCSESFGIALRIFFEDKQIVHELAGQLRPALKTNDGTHIMAVYIYGICFAHPKQG